MAESHRPHLGINPVIAGLTGEHDNLVSAIRCRGYVGDSRHPGRVRLYFSLNDISRYIEFEESAIVHIIEAPQEVLPEGGVYIWLRANSQVRAVRTRTMEARLLAGVIARNRRLRRWRWQRYNLLRQRGALSAARANLRRSRRSR